MNHEITRYCSRWKQLLEFEYKAQTDILNNRLQHMAVKDLQLQGYCITNIKLQVKGIFYGDRIARLSLNDSAIFPINHQFNDGNQIMLSRHHPLSSNYPLLKGSVLERNKKFIDVVLYQNVFQHSDKSNHMDKTITSGVWRLDVGVDEQTIQRMQYSLNIFNDEMEYKGSKLLQKMISQNYNDPSSLMVINKNEIMTHNPKYFSTKKDTNKSDQNTANHSLKNLEISQFQLFLTQHLLSNINKHLSQIRDKDSFLFKELESEISQIYNESELSLNESQLNAVKSSFENVISLIQGPPGTGKTKTAVELIYFASKIQQLTEKYYNKLTHRKRENPFVRKPILATAYTNAGVDQLLNGLLPKGLNIVRVGLPVRMHSEVRSVCLPSLIQNHCRNKEIHKIERRIIEINDELSSVRSKQLNVCTTAIRRIYKKQKQILFKEKQELLLKKEEVFNCIITDILSSADVVFATCVGCGSDAFVNSKTLQFSLIIIDEASQTIEPAVLIPLIHSCSRFGKLVLIGDQKQLPPLIISKDALQYGLDKTLFDRLIEAFSATKYLSHIPLFANNLLSIQYRMHPHIAQWPNSVVYHNKIRNAQSALDLDAFDIPGFLWPSKKTYQDDDKSSYFFEYNSPLILIDVEGKEYKRKSDKSVRNEAEANMIIKILSNIIATNQEKEDFEDILRSIGIITGYNAQVSLITDKLTEIYHTNSNVLDLIDIASVDGFQGREKDLILVSCVRSNRYKDIGFMSDDRRLNVALTRARRGLIVIGNSDTLSSDELWRNFIAFMRHSGRVVSDTNISHYLEKQYDGDGCLESLHQQPITRELVVDAITDVF